MTSEEYRIIQQRLTRKIIPGYTTKTQEAYNDGIRACKSIIKEIYESKVKGINKEWICLYGKNIEKRKIKKKTS